ncbi:MULTISPECIES: acetate/propionate family kinase [Flagellimonas]|uniref:acetate/propionate family kinase n=1 Tax=Flagellimonas TaxID=444459 RepID=UPI00197C33B9|nr:MULTISPECIES: acetate/propionate family kinase [Allomuricauda]MBW8242830.1 acetate/propionate family kinase [Allomuricauda oceani]
MKIYPQNSNLLTISAGPSSIRFAMYEMAENPVKELFGDIRHIGSGNEVFRVTHVKGNERENSRIYAPGFYQATVFLISWLKNQPGSDRIGHIGHKITYGLNHQGPKVIDTALLAELKQIADYIPDRLPAEIEIVETFTMRYPTLRQVACFDTSFHADLPRVAKILPIPRRFERTGIHRYGFHGLSFSHLMIELKKRIGIQKANGRVILVHLCEEASLTAVKEGKSIDTSMGFTPSGGLVMGTRSGDLDPGVVGYLLKKERLGAKQFNRLINHEGGLLGISETSANIHDLLLKEDADPRAAEAVALFCYQIRKYIGAFTTVLGGLDVLVFSGGIGENAPIIRSRICQGLDFLGIGLDEEQNRKNSYKISDVDGKVLVKVIHSDEETIIAKNVAQEYFKDGNDDKTIPYGLSERQKSPRASLRRNFGKSNVWDG